VNPVPRETVTIAVSQLAPYEAAAQLLALIAYPNSKAGAWAFL
jgi:hypothetical protein